VGYNKCYEEMLGGGGAREVGQGKGVQDQISPITWIGGE